MNAVFDQLKVNDLYQIELQSNYDCFIWLLTLYMHFVYQT